MARQAEALQVGSLEELQVTTGGPHRPDMICLPGCPAQTHLPGQHELRGLESLHAFLDSDLAKLLLDLYGIETAFGTDAMVTLPDH